MLHAVETGWRVNGKTHWLSRFTTRDLTYSMIDRSRGSPALLKFFLQEFSGTLVIDFWSAYNTVEWRANGASTADLRPNGVEDACDYQHCSYLE